MTTASRGHGASRSPRFELVVVRGGGVGMRLAVRADAQVIGRSVDAALPLTDRRVSRQHLLARASSRGVAIDVMQGASEVLCNGKPVKACEAIPGDEVVVGETVLAVVVVAEEGDEARAEGTDVRTLLTGVAADVRGLASVFALGEILANARDRASITSALTTWAREHVGASQIDLAFEDDLELAPSMKGAMAHPDRVVLESVDVGCVAIVPACAHPRGALAFHFAMPASKLPMSTQRALVVAGGICALAAGRIAAMAALAQDRDALRVQALGTTRDFSGESPAAQKLAKLLPRLAASDACVLLLGETGSGKTFVARLLHESSARKEAPFRVINCAAIPEHLVESELFGFERGAFTGAIAAREGAFEAAGSGTILLDEVGDMPLASQAKLLRVLEERSFQRIGSNRELALRARVLAATNRDLAAMVQAGAFRADLYYRLSVVTVGVPSLRERADDLAALSRQILADFAPTAGRRIRGFTPAALDAIAKYPWPGNVRELRNAIERAVVLGESEDIDIADLPDFVTKTASLEPSDAAVVRLPANLAWLEERAIEAALAATRGNRTHAAALLGIHRMTLVKKLKGGGS